MSDLSLQPPVVGLPWLHFIFLSSYRPSGQGVFSRPTLSKSLQMCFNGMASTCPLRFSCISTFRFGRRAQLYWKMMRHGPLYPFFCGLSRIAMAFRQRCLKGGSSLLVVWPEVGTVRSRMCLGESLDSLQGHSLARCITLNRLCPETLRR